VALAAEPGAADAGAPAAATHRSREGQTAAPPGQAGGQTAGQTETAAPEQGQRRRRNSQ